VPRRSLSAAVEGAAFRLRSGALAFTAPPNDIVSSGEFESHSHNGWPGLTVAARAIPTVRPSPIIAANLRARFRAVTAIVRRLFGIAAFFM
jgi:hypothetical protein